MCQCGEDVARLKVRPDGTNLVVMPRNLAHADVAGMQDLEKPVPHDVNFDRRAGGRSNPGMFALLAWLGHLPSLSCFFPKDDAGRANRGRLVA